MCKIWGRSVGQCLSEGGVQAGAILYMSNKGGKRNEQEEGEDKIWIRLIYLSIVVDSIVIRL